MIEAYRETFLEETSELLAELESALLDLGERPGDTSALDRAFRALHTLKGACAMFGLQAAVSLAHEAESMLEKVRSGALPVTQDLVRRGLQVRDTLRSLLSGASPGEGGPAAAGGEGKEPLTAMRRYLITYRPDRETFRAGGNPLLLIDELRELGSCLVSCDGAAVPALDQLDPTALYLSWEIRLETSADMETVREVFMLCDEEEVTIVSPADHADLPDQTGMAPVAEAGEKISSVRVAAGKLDQLVNLVGELVTVQAGITRIAQNGNDDALLSLAEELERLMGGLRENALKIRMLPIGSTFGRFRRVVHDLCGELGKEAELLTAGGETELDKTVIEKLADPLIHLIRNCVDHGIEAPEARVRNGKERCGQVTLSACHSGDSVVITVRDDGKGIDPAAVRKRAEEMGLLAPGEEIGEQGLLDLIFTPGFSTAAAVTSISGRGVGMDVVRRGVEALRGTISVTSTPGAGAEFSIRTPLTLAIIESLLVNMADEFYVVPLSLVEECLELTAADVARSHGRNFIRVRDEIVPYIRLRERFAVPGIRPLREQIVVCVVDGKRVGLVVDRVVGEHQTVIKPLGKMFREAAWISGATVLGDGTMGLIVDVPRLMQEELATERRLHGRDSSPQAA